MSRSIVVKSFAELAELLNVDELPEGPVTQSQEAPRTSASQTTTACSASHQATASDLGALLTELEEAGASLAAVARRDQEARASALRDLARYDSHVMSQREAEGVRERARQVRLEAEALAEAAFAEEAKAAARRTAEVAARTEAAANALAEDRRRNAEQLASQLDLERLLTERKRQEQAEKAKAAEAEAARRLSGALAKARAALDAGRFEEANGLLEQVDRPFSSSPELISLKNMIAQREMGVKMSAAEEALWTARRECRRDPAPVVARLEAVQVEGLPDELSRQLFGEWARACARLCRERGVKEPLRYAPDPGRGAVIAREVPGGEYMVVSALGMGEGWQAGSPVGERQVRRARPLR